ncbi:MAG TPA: hypothetical protein VEF04_11760 [Blastocatellia bacterium]|nr:hypothetical protein [Blastocatellia bacterium]
MSEISFELSGVPVRFTSDSPQLLNIFSNYFHYYSAISTDVTAAINVVLKFEQELLPAEKFAPEQAEFIAASGPVQMWREVLNDEEVYHFHAAVAAYRAHPHSGLLEAFISPQALDSPHLLANTYTFFPLLLLLRARSRYYLHTAAIISPQDRLYLICAGQRAGKSTLTVALGLAGWHPVADDCLLLSEVEGRAQLLPFKRDFHLSLEILKRWPELNDITKRHFYFDRACVGGLEFFGTSKLADLPREQVNALIFPQITSEPESRIERVAASEAILKLADQSMYFPLWTKHSAQQMNLLTQLTRRAIFYHLFAGTDILDDQKCAARILSEV